MKFQTQYDWKKSPAELNCGESIVDAAGYLSPKQRITNLIRAGERLEEFRRELYDYDHPDQDDGNWIDELRAPGLDYSDITAIQRRALSRLQTKSRQRSSSVDQDVNVENSEAKKQTTTPATDDKTPSTDKV